VFARWSAAAWGRGCDERGAGGVGAGGRAVGGSEQVAVEGGSARAQQLGGADGATRRRGEGRWRNVAWAGSGRGGRKSRFSIRIDLEKSGNSVMCKLQNDDPTGV